VPPPRNGGRVPGAPLRSCWGRARLENVARFGGSATVPVGVVPTTYNHFVIVEFVANPARPSLSSRGDARQMILPSGLHTASLIIHHRAAARGNVAAHGH
jgi:hypothetical protein